MEERKIIQLIPGADTEECSLGNRYYYLYIYYI